MREAAGDLRRGLLLVLALVAVAGGLLVRFRSVAASRPAPPPTRPNFGRIELDPKFKAMIERMEQQARERARRRAGGGGR